MPSFRRTLSSALRLARKERGLSQQQLAAKLGMRQSQISELEHGKNDIRLSTLTDVARVLGVLRQYRVADLQAESSDLFRRSCRAHEVGVGCHHVVLVNIDIVAELNWLLVLAAVLVDAAGAHFGYVA